MRTTLWDSLMAPASPDARLSVWQDGAFRAELWGPVVRAAEKAAVGLRRLGVQPGDRVGCVLTNAFDVCAGLLGVWLAGVVVVSLPTLARGMGVDPYLEQLKALCRGAQVSLLLVKESYAAAAPTRDGLRLASFGGLAAPGRLDPRPPGEDEARLLCIA